MRWIRQHIQSGAWLALTALALHFVLTFGHVHAEQFSPASLVTTSIAAADARAGGDVDGASEDRYRALRTHHSCPICASIDLLGTLVLPVAQAPVPLLAITAIRQLEPADAALSRDLRSSCKARAPPTV